jgi:hypothetical protein
LKNHLQGINDGDIHELTWSGIGAQCTLRVVCRARSAIGQRQKSVRHGFVHQSFPHDSDDARTQPSRSGPAIHSYAGAAAYDVASFVAAARVRPRWAAAGGVGPGDPAQNNFLRHYFTGRSDNFDPNHNSGFPFDARFDTEGIRISNDGLTVFISDEYGPYVYQFLRATGERLRTFTLPKSFYVATPGATGDAETAANTSSRVPNKGMEGLAITPDGRTLVGIMPNSLIQDAAEGGAAANMLRIVTIDILSGQVTHQFSYLLTTGSAMARD